MNARQTRGCAAVSLIALWAAGACSNVIEPPGEAMSSGGSGTSAGRAGAEMVVSPDAGSGGDGGSQAGDAGEAGTAGEAGSGGISSITGGSAGTGLGGTSSGGLGGTTGGSAGTGGTAGTAGAPPTPSELLGPHCVGCTAVAQGVPTWNLEGALIAHVPTFGSVGDADPLYTWLGERLSPNHPHYVATKTFGPGVAHAGPYGKELAALFASATVKQSFTLAQFSKPSGIVLVVVAVPNALAPLGSSPDFDSGPIIPNSLFPLRGSAILRLNGSKYDDEFDSRYIGLDKYVPPIVKNGSSHTIITFAENSSYVPEIVPVGTFDFQISVLDNSGVGWVVRVPFTVQ